MLDHLLFDGCDTVALAEEYGTPLYLISETEINNRCKILKDEFLNRYENTSVAYASKAFLNLAMCRIIDKNDLHLDVVSGGELFTALSAGYPMEKVFFHGNNKGIDELEMAITNDVGRIVVDNLYELELIQHIAEAQNKQVKILFRVTPGVDSDTHKHIVTGQKDSKFGIPLVDGVIYQAIKEAVSYTNIELMGFHFHVGSQLFNNQSHIDATEVLLKVMRYARDEYGFITKELNTGGGFGIRYINDDKPKSIAYFMDAIMDKIKKLTESYGLMMPRVIIEPGRWVIGEAGVTLYTVGSIKDIPGIRTYVGIDGGMPDNPRPALYGARYKSVLANRLNEVACDTVTIAGKCCETGDILIKDIDLPKPNPGDVLAVFSTGAYNYSMASNYNKIRRPGVVLVKEGKHSLIVKREAYEDLVSRDIMPEYL